VNFTQIRTKKEIRVVFIDFFCLQGGEKDTWGEKIIHPQKIAYKIKAYLMISEPI
jgi:hypothetical protein